jgi:hypothetical protein
MQMASRIGEAARTLETELRVLRRVTTANKHTARLLHGSVLPLSDALVQAQALPMPGTDSLGCVVWELFTRKDLFVTAVPNA